MAGDITTKSRNQFEVSATPLFFSQKPDGHPVGEGDNDVNRSSGSEGIKIQLTREDGCADF